MASNIRGLFSKIGERIRNFNNISNRSILRGVCIATGATALGVAVLATPVLATDLVAHPAKLDWPHHGMLASHDHGSLRRGYQVYKQVCAACHSMKYLSYRQLVDHVLTEDEAKADCAEILVTDGPNDEGKMFERPGRLADALPSPYPNPEAARYANAGALPPDLTFIVKARHGFEDYVYHLLTGFCDPPPGRTVDSNQHYNPYFPGGALGMAAPLYDEQIEYEDGTPATVSQMAKDVVSYLSWSSDRNHDKRKRILFKAVIILSIAVVLSGIYKRKKWANIKTRKVIYKNRPVPKQF